MKKLALLFMLSIGCSSAMEEGLKNTALSPTAAQSVVSSHTEIEAASQIGVARTSVLIDNFTVNILMSDGPYSAGMTNYTVLQAGGTLTTAEPITITWVNPAQNIDFSVATSDEGNSLILRSEVAKTN
jgi:hypothetical protein